MKTPRQRRLTEGLTREMSKYVSFWHSKTGHSQPLHPIGTIFSLNESLHYELHEVCSHPCKSQWAQFDKCSSLSFWPPNFCPNGAAVHEKTAYIRVNHQQLHRLTPLLLQWYLFVTRSPCHLKSCNLVNWVNSCEDFVVRSGVHTVGNLACALQLAVFKLRCSLPLDTKFRNCQLGRTYSIHISKVPLFRASADPLWENDSLCNLPPPQQPTSKGFLMSKSLLPGMMSDSRISNTCVHFHLFNRHPYWLDRCERSV